MLQMVIFGLFAMVLASAGAQNLPSDTIFLQGRQAVSLEQALSSVRPGQVIVLGEQHGFKVISDKQVQAIETLKKRGLKVSVGMEFFYHTDQAKVDAWRQGLLSEEQFLKDIQWGQGFPFEIYRRQVQLPDPQTEFVIALNAPRALTGRISKVGLAGLTEDEKALMPPDFQSGNADYFRRFKELMLSSGHVPTETQIQNYFAAQSVWDDTMAWQASRFLEKNPDQVLVIIVGDFHAQYGGGLPDRLKARGQDVTTFSMVNLEGLSDVEQRQLVEPSPVDGVRGDFVWTSRFDPSGAP